MKETHKFNLLILFVFCIYVFAEILVRNRTDLMAIITIVFAICESILLSIKIIKKRNGCF